MPVLLEDAKGLPQQAPAQHKCMYVHTYVRYTCMDGWVDVCVSVSLSICPSVRLSLPLYICLCVCVSACMHVGR